MHSNQASAAPSERHTVALLATCQALLFIVNSTLITINGLAGLALAPSRGLATLPVTFWVLGAAVATIPASLHMKKAGRRRGFQAGALWAVAGALVSAAAMGTASFWLLCLGALVFGVGNAYGSYYRFAAADAASAAFKSTAISLVLAGGLAGGVIGPALTRFTVHALPVQYMGAYLALIVFALGAIALLSRLRIPPPSAEEQSAAGRPIRVLAAQPKFIVAVLASAVGFGVMNFLMTSTPIAMDGHGHPYGDATFVISSHVVAMFAPSFFTGAVIKRFGLLRVMFTGALLNAAAIAAALAGVALMNYWWALVLLGVGWNFLFIGGTTLLTETYRPEERAKAQGTNDFAVFFTQVLSSLFSGLIVTSAGWERVNLAALPLVVLVAVAILWLAAKRRSAAAS